MSLPSPIPLYHWSPTTRRKQINRRGFVPNSRSVDGLWKPPHVCFANSAGIAWELSGRFHPRIPSWDLWQTWTYAAEHWELLPFDDGEPDIKEYRSYERIYKRHIWLVATRTNEETTG